MHLFPARTISSSSRTVDYPDAPPPLDYDIRLHRREGKIIFWFTLFFFEAGVLPLILFFSLKWGAHLSVGKNLAILTSIIGSASSFKLSQRFYYLWIEKDCHQRRPIGAGRWGVDFFQVLISLALWAFFTPLVVGSSLSPANVPTVSMALPLVMITFSLPLLITGLFPHHIRVPFRVSSLPALQPLPPMTYTIVEDVVAVDGGGCTEFRQAWRARYEASRPIRHLLRDTAVLWGASGLLLGVAFIIIAWMVADDVGYGICYGLPWLWAMAMGMVTYMWTQRALAQESKEWMSWKPRKEHTLNIVEGKHDPPLRRSTTHRSRNADHPALEGAVVASPPAAETTETARNPLIMSQNVTTPSTLATSPTSERRVAFPPEAHTRV